MYSSIYFSRWNIQNQGVSRAMLSLKTLGEESFLASSYLLVVTSNPGCPLAYRCTIPVSTSIFTWLPSPLCICFLRRAPVIGLRANPHPLWPHFNYILQKPCFQIGVPCGHEFSFCEEGRGHIRPSTPSITSVILFIRGASLNPAHTQEKRN